MTTPQTPAAMSYRDDSCPDCRRLTAGDCGKHGPAQTPAAPVLSVEQVQQLRDAYVRFDPDWDEPHDKLIRDVCDFCESLRAQVKALTITRDHNAECAMRAHERANAAEQQVEAVTRQLENETALSQQLARSLTETREQVEALRHENAAIREALRLADLKADAFAESANDKRQQVEALTRERDDAIRTREQHWQVVQNHQESLQEERENVEALTRENAELRQKAT